MIEGRLISEFKTNEIKRLKDSILANIKRDVCVSAIKNNSEFQITESIEKLLLYAIELSISQGMNLEKSIRNECKNYLKES